MCCDYTRATCYSILYFLFFFRIRNPKKFTHSYVHTHCRLCEKHLWHSLLCPFWSQDSLLYFIDWTPSPNNLAVKPTMLAVYLQTSLSLTCPTLTCSLMACISYRKGTSLEVSLTVFTVLLFWLNNIEWTIPSLKHVSWILTPVGLPGPLSLLWEGGVGFRSRRMPTCGRSVLERGKWVLAMVLNCSPSEQSQAWHGWIDVCRLIHLSFVTASDI